MGARGPRRRGFYSGADETRLMTFATCSGSAEVRRALLQEGGCALDEIGAARHLLLDARLELELLLHAGVQPVVELALGARVGARGAGGELRHQLPGALAKLVVRYHAVDQPPLERLWRVHAFAEHRQLHRAREAHA